MKYLLSRIFSCTNESRRLSDLTCPSTTLTSSLYSVIFERQNSVVTATIGGGGEVDDDKTRAKVNTSTTCCRALLGEDKEEKTLPANIRHSLPREGRGEEDDWIIIDSSLDLVKEKTTIGKPVAATTATADHHRHRTSTAQGESNLSNTESLPKPSGKQLYDMALNATDIDLIKASWINMRKDPLEAGLLLFEGLFTKFPKYLDYFPAFADLNLEAMREHKLLKRHATKVIDTVTFLVDSVGDSSKADKLNDALVGLVKGHLKRNVGLAEFRNLGIVLIDFICNINQRGSIEQRHEQDEKAGGHDRQHQQQAGVVVSPNNKLDVNAVVAAWTKLYASILAIVEREAAQDVNTAASAGVAAAD